MSYESTAEPIKVGYLMDFTLPPGFPGDLMASFTRCFDLVFEEAVAQGLMDRPVQMIYREVEGLPKGSVNSATRAVWWCSARISPTTAYRPGRRSRTGSKSRPSASRAPMTGSANGRSRSLRVR